MNRISLRVYLLLCRDNALDSTDRFGKWSRLMSSYQAASIRSYQNFGIRSCRCVVEGAGTPRSARSVGVDEDARGHRVRADQCESAWRGSVRKETFPFTQHYWIDEQQDLIRRPVFE